MSIKEVPAKLRMDQSLQCPKCKVWNQLGSEICSECGEELIKYERSVGDFARKKKVTEKK